MQLMTAHKILIACALLMFVFYAAVQAWRALAGDSSALTGLLLALPMGAILAVYLRWLWTRRP